MGKASDIGDRLSVYAGGMLTLVAFKYGVSEQLPSVPYSTVTDSWLVSQIGTIIFVMAEALLGYELTAHNVLTVEIMGLIDIVLLGVLGLFWVGALIRMGCWRKKQRRSWDVVEKKPREDAREAIRPVTAVPEAVGNHRGCAGRRGAGAGHS